MSRFFARFFLLIFPALYAVPGWAQEPAAPEITEASVKTASPAPRVAPIPKNSLFGSIPISTRSEETRKLLEQAIDQYENVLLDLSVANAHKAAERDPKSPLAFAVWSFAARRDQPSAEALRKAETLASRGTPDEQLLVRWMTSLQKEDMLPAISAMNDLLARYPGDKHILYLTSEWLYFQQDYERSRQLMEAVYRIDPSFPPALNMLGYAYVETGTPDPEKAIGFLKRYAALQPHQPNPQDSLGEVSRFVGDDAASLEHYAAALKIIPNFITSQVGLGDTSALMGNYTRARAEYDKAIPMATNARDRLHAEYQKALVHFWEGHPSDGRKALDALFESAQKVKEPYAQFEIGFARAMLAEGLPAQLGKLRDLQVFLDKPLAGMSDSDRNISLAGALREEARLLAQARQAQAALEVIAKLEKLADRSRDLIIENAYESARGFALFAEGDFANAADELAADPHSVLILNQLALAKEKLGDRAAADAIRTRIKFMRGPTIEWFLLTHAPADAGS